MRPHQWSHFLIKALTFNRHWKCLKIIRNKFCILHLSQCNLLISAKLSQDREPDSWTGSAESWTGSAESWTDSAEATASDFRSGSQSSGLSFLVSAMSRLTPTIHWLTSVTWSTIRERWILSAASQWPAWSSGIRQRDRRVKTHPARGSGKQTAALVRQVTLREGVHASPHRKAQFTSLPAVLQ